MTISATIGLMIARFAPLSRRNGSAAPTGLASVIPAIGPMMTPLGHFMTPTLTLAFALPTAVLHATLHALVPLTPLHAFVPISSAPVLVPIAVRERRR